MIDTSRFGIFTPVLTLIADPKLAQYSDWERTATIRDIAAIVAAAERLGYDHITCSEHVGIPVNVEAVRGARYYDPLATFGYLAALTSRIRFATYVLVLGYSHPLEIAKRYGTLDVMCEGRLVLGVGVGSLQPEFELLGLGGKTFEQRGQRGDDALRAIRAAWGRRQPEYHGEFYDFQGFIIDPCGVREHVPLWIGGSSMASLRRAVELGDGWVPYGSPERLRAMLVTASGLPNWSARSRPLEIVLRHEGLLDPMGAPEQAAEVIRSTFAIGATKVELAFNHKSRSHYIEQLEAFSALPID